jgi:hypothetical protein
MKLFYTQVRRLVLLSLTILLTSNLFGQISIATLPYMPGATNFNSYNPNTPANYAATIPTGWTGTTGGTTTYNGQGTGTTFNGGYWAYGSAGEYCLGAMPSGASTPITYAISFTNNSGSTINTLTFSWDYEQWSYSNGNNNTWDCSGTVGLLGNATVNAQDYSSVGGTNGTVSTTSISFTLTGLNITNGSTFGIQWSVTDAGSSAPDKGIGIDNFNIVASNTANTDYFRSRQTGNWATVTTWESSKDNITWVNSSLTPDNNANTVTILNGHTVTVAASVSTDETTINSGGQVTVSGGQTLTITNGAGTDLAVDGTLINSGTITPTGTIAFNANSLYTHAVNGGTIPTATWNTTSTCSLTSITNTVPAGLTQSFGNFTYSCPNHNTTISFLGALTTINGNFTINQAGNPQGIKVEFPLVLTTNTNTILTVGGNFTLSNTGVAAWFALTNGTATVTMNVAGNFNMSGTTTFFDYNISTAQNSALIINVTGNYTQSGGFLDWAWTPTTGSVASELRVGGNFSHTGSSIISMTQANTASTVPNGKITFNKAGNQTFTSATPTNIGYTNYDVASGSTLELLSSVYLYSSNTARWGGNFVIKTGAILDANTNQFQSLTPAGVNNVFTLETGAGLITANVNGVQSGTVGTVYNVIATRTFSSGANYTYDGVAVQNSGIFTTTPTANQVNNLTINNTAGKYTTGVTLQQAIAVAGTCTFTAGVFTTTSALLLTFNDNAIASGANNNATYPSFVNGPTRKIGNDAFTFPVGKVVGPTNFSAYMLCGISAPASTTDVFDAEFMRASATALGPITAVGLVRVSFCEYWRINRTTGSSAVNITLSWSGVSNCNAAAYVTNLSSLVVAHFNATSWDTYGSNSSTGNVSAGTVTWNNISTFNGTGNTPFSLGSTSQIDNPLPVKFTSVMAYKVQAGNKVEWTNMTEESVIAYELEKSDNGRNFYLAFSQQPRMNNGSKADYNWIDVNPNSSITYYRIKATDLQGTVTYSPVVKVQTGSGANDVFTVYPNPVISHQFTIQLSGKPDTYKIRLLNNFGQEIMNSNWQHNGGIATRTIELSPSVSSGVYHLQVIGKDQTRNTKIYIQ